MYSGNNIVQFNSHKFINYFLIIIQYIGTFQKTYIMSHLLSQLPIKEGGSLSRLVMGKHVLSPLTQGSRCCRREFSHWQLIKILCTASFPRTALPLNLMKRSDPSIEISYRSIPPIYTWNIQVGYFGEKRIVSSRHTDKTKLGGYYNRRNIYIYKRHQAIIVGAKK